MQRLLYDMRFGARMLLKSPAVTAVAVISLALGISANTVIFSVINSVLLKSLPYKQPDGIVLVSGDSRAENSRRNQVSATDVADWRAQNSVFEDVATYTSWRPILSGVGEPQRVPAMQVGDGYFKIMKGEPILGRTFLPEEQEDGKDFVIVLGYRFASWGTSIVESLGVKVNWMLGSVPLDLRVLGFTIAISLLTGVVFGLAPALHLSKPDLNESLKEGGRSSGAGAGRNRLRSALVVSEVAMALVLLICAVLFIKTVVRLRNVNTGFDPENILTMNIALPNVKYPKPGTWISFYDQALGRIQALPGVQSAGVVSVLPLSGNFDGRGLVVETRPKPRGEEISVDLYIATPGYLDAMRIPLQKGRPLTEQDVESSPLIALVNQSMAEGLWPNEDPLGKRIRFPGSERNPQPWRTVVGVVSDVTQYGLDKKPAMQMYLPQSQFPTSFMTLVVRTGPNSESMISAVRNQILGVDKDQAVYKITTMEQLLSDSISLRRFSMLMLLIFAVVAVTLAAVGVYGVISYSVTQRSREIGIRMALGASRNDILRLIVGHGMTLAGAGDAIGLVAALGLTRGLTSLLFGVSATDPATFALVAFLFAVVSLLACYVPARRATKVDPMVAVRYE